MSKQAGSARWLRQFEPLERIGEGSFSSVYKVRRIADGRLYALKKVRSLPSRSNSPRSAPKNETMH